jgi:hypothetical protein
MNQAGDKTQPKTLPNRKIRNRRQQRPAVFLFELISLYKF